MVGLKIEFSGRETSTQKVLVKFDLSQRFLEATLLEALISHSWRNGIRSNLSGLFFSLVLASRFQPQYILKTIKSVSAAAFGGEVSVIPWANYESADWGKYSVTVNAERSMSNEELTIIVKGIEGDFMIDHILLTSSLNTEGCKSSVDLEFTPGES